MLLCLLLPLVPLAINYYQVYNETIHDTFNEYYQTANQEVYNYFEKVGTNNLTTEGLGLLYGGEF